VAALTAGVIEESGWTDRVIVSSFQVATLLAVQAADSGLALGALWGFTADPGAGLDEARAAGFAAVHPFVTLVDDEFVPRAHGRGLAVNVWTVNAPGDLQAMVALGVDAVITDRVTDAVRTVRAARAARTARTAPVSQASRASRDDGTEGARG
jgi:glycerophosphoryl diester phosphodiesterase